MKNSWTKGASITAVAMAFIASSTAAFAQDRGGYGQAGGYYYNTAYEDDGNYDRDYEQGAQEREDGRYRDRRCGGGTTGLVLGAAVGGLLGRKLVGRRGDQTAGTIAGAGAGALAGRAIAKSGKRC